MSKLSASSDYFPKQDIGHIAIIAEQFQLDSYNKMKGVWDSTIEPVSVSFRQNSRVISPQEYEEGETLFLFPSKR
jgi:hypothetical protein